MTIKAISNKLLAKKEEMAVLKKAVKDFEEAPEEKKRGVEGLWYKDNLKRLQALPKEIDDLERTLQDLRNSEPKRDIKPIVECLEKWKERYIDYCKDLVEEYKSDCKSYEDLQNTLFDRYDRYEFNSHRESLKKEHPEDKELQEYSSLREKLWGHSNYYDVIKPYTEYGVDWSTNGLKHLNNDLEEEANRKYDNIISRTISLVGQIQDASDLRCGMDGSLNGIITGEKGKVEVFTIIAGGPIQRDHFRVLVKPRK